MVVKRKVLTKPEEGGSIDLSADLKKVRDAISTLPDDEELMNQEAEEVATKKASKKIAKKVVAKKVVAKKTAAPAAAKSNGKDQVTLSDLCKSLKIEPSAARRQLRKAEVENPGRWTWDKGSKALQEITKLLSAE